MRVSCQGCAGCCIDWRPLLEDEGVSHTGSGHPNAETGDKQGPRRRAAIDDVYNLVSLSRDDVRGLLETGYGDVLVPRLWAADSSDDSVDIDGYELAAIHGRPVFFVGLAKPPKPVAPFGRDEPEWLPSCAFLDPTTLQCRIHDEDHYPEECAEYPAHNVALEHETECERVESAFGGTRLLRDDGDSTDEPPSGEPKAGVDTPFQTVDVDEGAVDGLLLGPQAIGQKLFVHPAPDELEGRIERLAAGEATLEDRATFVAVAAGSAPGTVAVSEPHRERAYESVLAADSWAGKAIEEWARVAADESPDPALAAVLEDGRGAPETPGW
ncbi:YkgJ family cysteine cluster protein [Halobacteria archaeon AArc-curdl1]|uniref:YkgJ family cysteine cluster protein n=1 Tax=Natronosalvus hydrolyticus TaxID=2979988 RepID=A0AAP2ZAG0_9EURY|nr:YkgJ family cysteine cluster protein [Halobacteria archaeon AArc-curdl1]